MASFEHQGWIRHYGSQNIEKFLEKNKPSEITDPSVFWVYVAKERNRKQEVEPDIPSMLQAWKEMTHTKQTITPDDLKRLAVDTQYTSGKWLVYCKPHYVDEVWAKIATSLVEGKLGEAAKVSSRSSSQEQGQHNHVICVYTSDFTDEADVYRVAAELHRLGISGKITYKPDIYTTCGIYARNAWRIPATVYSSRPQ